MTIKQFNILEVLELVLIPPVPCNKQVINFSAFQAFNDGKALIPYKWSFNPRYDDAFVPKSLLHHRKDYQKVLYDGMVKDLKALQEYISILKRHVRHVQRTNNFNETLFSEVRKSYVDTIDNFKYEFNLFKDAIVHRTKELVEDTTGQFKKVQGVLLKEEGDTQMVISQSLDLAYDMRDNIWPEIQGRFTIFSFLNFQNQVFNSFYDFVIKPYIIYQ